MNPLSIGKKTEMRICVYVLAIGPSLKELCKDSEAPIAKPLCHIDTHMHISEFFATDT